MFPDHPQFARQLRIANLLRVEVRDAYTHPMFYLEGANIMQERSPAFVFRQVLSHMTGKKNVPGVATIHYPPGHVDAASGHVGAFGHVHHTTDRSTVNAHPNLQARIVLERAADLYRTLRRFLRALVENQRHAVAGGDPQKATGSLCFAELLGKTNNLIQFLNLGVLLVNREFGVTDNVDEEDVRDL